MWYRVENGVIIGGPFNCDQPAFPVVEYDEASPEAIAFNAACSAGPEAKAQTVP